MSEETRKRPTGLGRGLSSLLGENPADAPVSGEGTGVRTMAVSAIEPNQHQPRQTYDNEALAELAASLAAHGMLQPILVRPHGHRFQIVAGERRWRAAQIARIHEVPVIVRDIADADMLELALIENIQREDLNVIEEAEGYRRLIADFGHSQEALGQLVHKSRSHVANLLRLLDLPGKVRAMLVAGDLQMGHARALAGAADPEAIAAETVRKGLSVRAVEKLVREGKGGGRTTRGVGDTIKNPDIDALERQLGEMLGIRVAIAQKGKGGTLSLSYSSLDQLDMLCQRLSGDKI